MAGFRERVGAIKSICHRPWVRCLVWIWAAIGAYDTFAQQLLPEEWAKKSPTVYKAVTMTSGLLPWWGWLLIFMGIATVASIEYGVRNRRQKSPADHERGTSRSEPNAEVISAQAALERERRLQDKQNQAREGIREAAPSVSALQMAVGETGPYFDTEGGVYDIRRTFNLKLKNTDRSKSVSNCSVHILSVTPPTDYEGPWRLREGLELAAGDHVFIPLVNYGEAREPDKNPYGDDFMTMGTENGRPHLDVGEKYTVTLRATAPETPYCEYQCRIWVDENGRLRIEGD